MDKVCMIAEWRIGRDDRLTLSQGSCDVYFSLLTIASSTTCRCPD